jgi:hypothetical protein
MKQKFLGQVPIKKYAKTSGFCILGLLVFFILFCIYLNSQDLNKLDMKNSDRRKIQEEYSENKMLERKNKFLIFRKNEKLKKKRGTYINRKSNFFNTQEMKKNISNYKKKMKAKNKN